MTKSNFEDVGNFNSKFGLPKCGDDQPPHLLSDHSFQFRFDFLQEELGEMLDAHVSGDLEKFADAIVDLVYVALGTAHLAHIPFDAVWAEVHRANMAKERASGADDARSTRKHILDVVKPEGWQPADVRRILGL